MPIDEQKLRQWVFPTVTRQYSREESARMAKGFGAGRAGALAAADEPFLKGSQALPMIAVALADGEFWQRNPATGIDWRRIVHAEEGITMHRPLPPEGAVVITQRVAEIFDRGADKGAVMQQQQFLHTPQGELLVTIDVTTVLKGDGGFGGRPQVAQRVHMPQDRPADQVLDLRTPLDNEDAIFRLSRDIAVAADLPAGQSMMRGLGCFGLAGRAVLSMTCANQPQRLESLRVRYAGPMLSDETMLLELWNTVPGQAVFRMLAVERDALVLNQCQVAFAA